MKTRIDLNSKIAYEQIRDSLPRRRRNVFSVIYHNRLQGVTSFNIAEHLGLGINSITGRINELMHDQLIRVKDVRYVNGKPRNIYMVRWEGDEENVFPKSIAERAKEMIFRIQMKLIVDRNENIFIFDYVKDLNQFIEKLKKEYQL